MKKILSVMLVLCMMISLCATFAIMPSFAAETPAETPAYDATSEGFSITVTDERGLKAGFFNAGISLDEVYKLYNNGYNDDAYGIYVDDGEGGYKLRENNSETSIYHLNDPSALLTTGISYAIGGFYNSAEASSFPMNQFPINMDIDLGGAKEISGVRVNTRLGEENDGFIKKYDVYVMFPGDTEWTYIITDGNTGSEKKDIETNFAQNIKATKVRISVTESSTKNGKTVEGKYGPNMSCYFYASKVSVLKPYNSEGGVKYITAPKTAEKAEDLIELIGVKATKGEYVNNNSGFTAERAKSAIDSDLSTTTWANGSVCVDFGKDVLFSGIVYYPPRNYNTVKGLTSIGKFNTFNLLTKEFEIVASTNDKNEPTEIAKPDAGRANPDVAALTNALVYATDASNVTDYSKPIVIEFGKNVSARGLEISSWKGTEWEGTDFKTDGSVGIGEIRLLKPIEHWEGYYNDEIVKWDSVPAVTSMGSSNGRTAAGSSHLFDRAIYSGNSEYEGHKVWPNDGKVYTSCDYGLNDNGKAGRVTIVADLGKEYEFSAVRLFSRLGQPDQAFMEGKLYVSDDGKAWSPAMKHSDEVGSRKSVPALSNTGEDTTAFLLNYKSSGDMYTDLKGKLGKEQYNLKARYIKIEVTKTSNDHFSAQEILLVKPDSALETKAVADLGEPDYSNGYYLKDDVVKWDEDISPKIIEKAKVSPDSSKSNTGLSDGFSLLFDTVVYVDRTEDGALNSNMSFDWGFVNNTTEKKRDGSYIYYVIDLGKEYEFSALRVFGKIGQPLQFMKTGEISFSADKTTWTTGFYHTDGGTKENDSYFKYSSSNDMYTDMKVEIGTGKNVKARYIKVLATDSMGDINGNGNGQHVGFSELMLVKPVAANGTALTPTELENAVASYVASVVDKFNAIGEVTKDSGDEIEAAREAYDSLPENFKKLISADELKVLTDAEAAFAALELEAIAEAIDNLPTKENVTLDDADTINTLCEKYNKLSTENQNSLTNKEKLLGAKSALDGLTFTVDLKNTVLGKKENHGAGTVDAVFTLATEKKISKVTYNGTDYTEEDGWFTQAADTTGNVVLTLGGKWAWNEYPSWSDDTVGGAIGKGKKVTLAADVPFINKTSGTDISAMTGVLTHRIVMNDPMGGDHFITVTFEDGKTKDVNILTKGVEWKNVKNAVWTSAADEIKPSTSWKVAQSDGLDTFATYAFANGTQGQKFYETRYQGGSYKVDGGETKSNLVWYDKYPFTYYIDLADNEEAYKGLRFYARDGQGGANVGIITVYGTDDLEDGWTKLGTYDVKSQGSDKDVIFNEDNSTVTYRYLRMEITELANARGTFSTKNISLIKPYVTVDGSDTIVCDNENNNIFDSAIKFNMIEGANAIDSLKKNTTLIGEESYTFENGTLTFKADFIKGLAEGKTTFTVKFNNGNEVAVYIEKKDCKTVDYWLAGSPETNISRGSGVLTLSAFGGRQVKTLKIKGTSVPFAQSGYNISVTRYDFRALQLWDDYKTTGKVTAVVTYADDITTNYTINLKGAKYAVGSKAIGTAFASDEIKPGSAWTIETDSMNNAIDLSNMLISGTGGNNWHTGYTVVGGSPIGDDTKNPHYLDIDLGAETTFSGVRVYKRTDDMNSGHVQYATVYGRNEETEEWIELGSVSDWAWDKTKTDEHKDLLLDNIAKCRYVRLEVQSATAHTAVRWVRFITAKSSFKNGEMVPSEVAMDFDLGENANVKAVLNGAGAIKSLSCKGKTVAEEYVIMTKDTISISPYFFTDNGYKSGDSVEFSVGFVFGDPATFTVKVGEVDGHIFTFKAGENGSVSASAYNETIGNSEAKNSGDKVRTGDKLTFTAVPDTGYEVDSWSVRSTTPVYNRVSDTLKKSWTATASSDNSGSSARAMIDGNVDTVDNYWHSKYFVVDGVAQPDTEFPYVLTFDFNGVIENAKVFEFLPRTSGGIGVKDYKLYVMEEDKEDWTLASEGRLSEDNNLKSIEFNKIYNISKLKFEIDNLYGKFAYITEIYIKAEQMPTGTVVRRGTASQDFEIDDRFTDMEVSVTFKEKAAGTVSAKAELENLSSDIKATYAVGTDAEVSIDAKEGYVVPESIVVMVDGATLKQGVDYSYVIESTTSAKIYLYNLGGKKLVVTASGVPAANNHKVSYVDNLGATGKLPADSYVIEGDDVVVASGKGLKLTGYTFDGWEYEGTVYKAGEKVTMGTTDMIFVASWKVDNSKKDETGATDKPSSKPSGSTKPSGSGGSGGGIGAGTTGIGSTSGKVNVTINGVQSTLTNGSVVPAPTAPEGYTFSGWYLDEAHTVPYANTGVTENVTLYPAFTKNRNRDDLTDIKDHWAYESIASLYEQAIVNGSGDGKYKPDDNITRAEFIQILYNMSKMTSDGAQKFKDVGLGDWFMQAVAWAVQNGITSGTTEDTFSPYDNITREQMAAMIYRYATLMGADWQTEENGEFADGDSISDYAKYYVRWAKGEGIINGRDDGTFGPKDNATRAESAAMLSRLLK